MDFYDYPRLKQTSPFEPIEADNYFAMAGKISYLGDYEEIGNIKSPDDKRNVIFGGAYVLNILKRHSVVEGGRHIYTNENFHDGHIIGASRLKSVEYVILTDKLQEYTVDSWGTQLLKAYTVQNDDGSYNCSLQLKLFSDADSAILYAMEISKNTSMRCVVAQWFADIDRH